MPVNFQIIQTPEWILYNCPNCGEEHEWHYEDFLKYYDLNSDKLWDIATTIEVDCQDCGFNFTLSGYKIY